MERMVAAAVLCEVEVYDADEVDREIKRLRDGRDYWRARCSAWANSDGERSAIAEVERLREAVRVLRSPAVTRMSQDDHEPEPSPILLRVLKAENKRLREALQKIADDRRRGSWMAGAAKWMRDSAREALEDQEEEIPEGFMS